MSEVFAIQIADGRWFCGWHYYEWKQGKEAMFSEHAPQYYSADGFEIERDFQLLKKRKHRPTKRAVDLLSGGAKSAGLAQPANH